MFVRILLILGFLPPLAWSAAALWFDGPASRGLAGGLAIALASISGVALVAMRSRLQGAVVCTVLFAIVLTWWFSLEPSNQRAWQPDVARSPKATIEGNRVTIRNVRDFAYRTESEYAERWEERHYDLSQLVGADLFMCSWGSPYIVHTILSWEFLGGDHLAVSIETRKEVGESYSAVLGFFRQFELYYVVADERDVVRLRTNFRGEDCRLYRMTHTPDQVRAVLLDYLAEINRLAEKPEWYNAATHNCTTTIRQHAMHVGAGKPWDWRVLVNGRLDELGWERGTIDRSLPFEEMRARSDITRRAQDAGGAADFSSRIREGLPGEERRRATARSIGAAAD